MSLKDSVDKLKKARRPGLSVFTGYSETYALNVLFSYINELENALEEAKKPAPKKAPAKKAPAKKAPAKKKTSAKKKS